MCGLVGGPGFLPFRLRTRATVNCIPRIRNFGGNIERCIVPAKGFPHFGDLVVAERRPVGAGRALFVWRTIADDGLAANHRRAFGIRYRRFDGGCNNGTIVAVDMINNLPAVRFESLCCIVREPAFGLPIDRNAIVVVETDQFAKFKRARQ